MPDTPSRLEEILVTSDDGRGELFAMCLGHRMLRDEMVRKSESIKGEFDRNIHYLTQYGRSSNSLGPLTSSDVTDLNRNAAIFEEQRKAIVIVCRLLRLEAKVVLQATLDVAEDPVG